MPNTNDTLDLLCAAVPSNYTVDGFLSEGGQGAVFRGSVDGRAAALKLFAPATDPGFRRLEREVALLRSIACPHLVQILDDRQVVVAGVSTHLVAYELLGGGDLTRCLAAATPDLSSDELSIIGEHVGTAMQSLWARRIVHRDIKPANIMQRGDDNYVLVDVGLARHVQRSNITAPGLAAGTGGFMSPEQALGRRNLTINSDVFSLGVTLYLLASRIHPYGSAQHLIGAPHYTPQPLESHRPDLPEPLIRLIHLMMNVRPADRPHYVQDRFRSFLRKPARAGAQHGG